MRKLARRALKTAINAALDGALPPSTRLRLGHYILDRELGEGNSDAAQNGERELLRRIKERLRGRSATVFDVGANVGAWTLELAGGMTDELRVFAFEPVPATFARLTENLHARALGPKVTPLCIGLSDGEGEIEIHLAGGLAETNSFAYRAGVTEAGALTVRRTRGDAFCRERQIADIDLLKVDVEGHELAVLHGFEALLNRQGIGCIQFEYGRTWIDSRTFLADAHAYLTQRGYRLGKLTPHGVRAGERYDAAMDNFRFANWIAVTPEWQPFVGEWR